MLGNQDKEKLGASCRANGDGDTETRRTSSNSAKPHSKYLTANSSAGWCLHANEVHLLGSISSLQNGTYMD